MGNPTFNSTVFYWDTTFTLTSLLLHKLYFDQINFDKSSHMTSTYIWWSFTLTNIYFNKQPLQQAYNIKRLFILLFLLYKVYHSLQRKKNTFHRPLSWDKIQHDSTWTSPHKPNFIIKGIYLFINYDMINTFTTL